MANTKVLIITYYFPPSGGAGVQRWLKMLPYLQEEGVEPYVLTVNAQFASYPQLDESLLKEIPQNLPIRRTKTKEILFFYKKVSPNKEIPYGGFANEQQPNAFQKFARFIRGNFFLPDPRKGWNKYAFKAACEWIEQEGIQTVVTTSPPHSTQLVGLQLKKKYPSIKWIADLRDPWTDIYYQADLYATSLAQKINARYEKQVLEQADEVVTVSKACAQLFQAKLLPADQPSPEMLTKKIHVIPNGYDASDFVNTTSIWKEHPEDLNKMVLSYVGVLSPQYSIDLLLQTLQALPADKLSQLKLRFVGQVCAEHQAALRALPVEVEFVSYVPHKQSVAYMCAADILLLVIPSIPNNEGILTGKLFEYLATRKPIFLIGPAHGDAAAIVQQCEAGQCFDPTEPSSQVVPKAVEYIQNHMLVCPLPASTEYKKYSRQAAAQQFKDMFVPL